MIKKVNIFHLGKQLRGECIERTSSTIERDGKGRRRKESYSTIVENPDTS